MRARSATAARVAVWLAIVPLAAIAMAVDAGHSTFFHRLDSAAVVGNASGGSGCSESFAAGLGGWLPAIGSPVAAGGFVEFQNPGQSVDTLRTVYDLLLEREDIVAPSACDLSLGGGNATLTTVWESTVPDLPGNFYGHQLVYALTPTLVESILVTVNNPSAEVAAELGLSPGLQIQQSKLLLDTTDPGAIVLAAAAQVDAVPIYEAQLLGATGQRIYLRLEYDDGGAFVTASYSLDAGASFQTPFAGMSSSFGGLAPARFWATGAATSPIPPIPGLGGLALAALAAGLIAAARLSGPRSGDG